jgi:hypothetical protein
MIGRITRRPVAEIQAPAERSRRARRVLGAWRDARRRHGGPLRTSPFLVRSSCISLLAALALAACGSDDPSGTGGPGSGGSGNGGPGAGAGSSGEGGSGAGNTGGTGSGNAGVGGSTGIPCAEGAIDGACDCAGVAHASGWCCSDQWFDPYYETLIDACPAADAFRYVDPGHASANDANPGTVDQPWATIEHGVATTVGGQVLVVAAGTYQVEGTGERYAPALNPQSGAAGAPVILMARGEVIVEPRAIAAGTAQGGSLQNIVLAADEPGEDNAYYMHHVRIVGGTGAGQSRQIMRDFDNPGAVSYEGDTKTAWVTMTAAQMGNWDTAPDATSQYEIVRAGPVLGTLDREHVVWDGFHVRERSNYHPDTGPVVVWASQHVVLLNNDVEAEREFLYDNHNALRINDATDVVIRNNRIHGVGIPEDVGPGNQQNHAAVMIYTSSDVIIEHNEIYDSYTGVYPKGDYGGHHVRFNVIRDCGKALRFSYHTDVLVYQNVIHDCEIAIQPAEEITGIQVFNNVIHRCNSGVHNWFPISGTSVFNNIYLGVDHPVGWEGDVGELQSDHNVYFDFVSFLPGGTLAGWQAMGFDAASIEADPSFVDADAHDYHLGAGSPALGVGVDLGDLDGDGDTGETIPAGAYVTGTEIIGRLAEP